MAWNNWAEWRKPLHSPLRLSVRELQHFMKSVTSVFCRLKLRQCAWWSILYCSCSLTGWTDDQTRDRPADGRDVSAVVVLTSSAQLNLVGDSLRQERWNYDDWMWQYFDVNDTSEDALWVSVATWQQRTTSMWSKYCRWWRVGLYVGTTQVTGAKDAAADGDDDDR